MSSLAAAARLYLWQRLPGGRVAACPWVSLGFALFSIALWIALDRWGQDTPVLFDPAGLPGMAWYVLGTLAIAAVGALCASPRESFDTMIWAIAVLSPLAVVGSFIASFHEPAQALTVLCITALVMSAYLMRALNLFSGRLQIRVIALLLVATGAFWVLSDAMAVNPSVWIAPEEPQPGNPWVDAERLLYRQPARIALALEQVAPHSGSAPQAYFLGFAGVGEQRVFAQEVRLAAKVVGERYGTSGRTVLLINDQQDLDSAPLATVEGLEMALKGLAMKMDVRRDVLFLVLSSHGSEEPLLSVSNAGMPLDQLDAQTLAAALDDAGIRHRVIIISACYAGAFIPSLRNEDSIILTAAAADRSSFGCSNDRDLTYFGEAFFRDALPESTGLKDAFERAKEALALREKAERETPSLPQGFFGSRMEADLERQSPSAGG